ncbi:hypothetical protein PR048_015643 [Dryococelus australis]|uniref:Retroviral polymerase SH3-like domain-containing protein n=1 Tax=Dryococelus australis TaxID=614101 RepID=A0ABQ9HHL0_9NEOP|nr:hypothetical protein PR048_015643 [Dryococelus australis]
MRLVGYCGEGYRLWDPEEDKIIQSRDVVFDEDVIFNKELFTTNEENLNYIPINRVNTSGDEEKDFHGFDEEGNIPPRRPKRKVNKTTKLNDYEIYTAYCLCAGEPADYPEAMKTGEGRSLERSKLIQSLQAEFNAKDQGKAFAKSFLSRHLKKPTNQLWIAGKRILGYLKRNREVCLTFEPNTDKTLSGYSDADWAGDKRNHKNTSGAVIFHGHNPILWSSKKQSSVALSTAETEYIACATTAADLVYLQDVLQDLENKTVLPILYTDNQCHKHGRKLRK